MQTRRRLVKQPVGLIGARAIRRELRKVLGQQTPSLPTIKRVLQTHGLVSTRTAASHAYFPKPLTTIVGTLHALDWTCRYIEAGPKVYAFHTLNLHTRAGAQTIAADKSSATVIRHCLNSWKTLGIPQFLQLDNDAAFCGGYQAPRSCGQFVRLCLYLGIELIFLPIAEPACNPVSLEGTFAPWQGAARGSAACHTGQWSEDHFGEVEELNGLSLEGPLGARLLGAPTVCVVRARVSSQSSVCPMVYDGLCAARVGRPDAQASATPRIQTASHRDSDCALAGSGAADRRTDSLHSPGQARRDSGDPQRNMEGEQTLGRQICVGHRQHAWPSIGHLVSAVRTP